MPKRKDGREIDASEARKALAAKRARDLEIACAAERHEYEPLYVRLIDCQDLGKIADLTHYHIILGVSTALLPEEIEVIWRLGAYKLQELRRHAHNQGKTFYLSQIDINCY